MLSLTLQLSIRIAPYRPQIQIVRDLYGNYVLRMPIRRMGSQIFHLLSDSAALIGNANRQIGGIESKRRHPLYQLIQTPLVVAAMRQSSGKIRFRTVSPLQADLHNVS